VVKINEHRLLVNSVWLSRAGSPNLTSTEKLLQQLFVYRKEPLTVKMFTGSRSDNGERNSIIATPPFMTNRSYDQISLTFYSAVRTESLHKTDTFRLKRVNISNQTTIKCY
jgi:hypothetical protein